MHSVDRPQGRKRPDKKGAFSARQVLYLTACAFIFLFFASVSFAQTTSLTISDEVEGNNATGRATAATMDDAWAAGFPSGAFMTDLFVGGSGLSGSRTFTDPIGSSYRVDWQLGYLNALGPGLPTSTTFVNATGGSATYGTSNSIQSNAPNPYPTGDTRVSTNISGTGLKAIQFDFTNSTTDIYAFGIYVGDLESRPNNGTEGRVILYDTLGAVIGDHPILYTGTVHKNGSTSTYTVTEPLGSPSGPANNNSGDWGNRTTAFLSIDSDTIIGYAVIHVGDDDHTSNNDGATEQLGLTAFQLPAEPYTPAAAVLTASKTVAAYDPVLSPYAIPGNDMIYTFTVTNTGTGPADNDSIVLIDALPTEITFYNGDIDDTGPETGVVAFAETGTGLTFNQASDLAFSNAATKPADFTACTYAPAAGYDPLITYICLNPSGAMAAGDPDPAFTIDFRARID